MTTYTETQLITHAARKSGRLGEDETLSAEGLLLYQKMARSRIAALAARDLYLWNYTRDVIPEELMDPLADYLAMFILASGGGPRPTDSDILLSETILRQIGAKKPTGATQQAEYF
jgi:hypothetical protein